MRKAAIFAGLFLLCGLTAAHAGPCQLVRYAQLPMENTSDGALVPVGINGTKTRFLVDTSAALSMLSETTVTAQKLPQLSEERIAHYEKDKVRDLNFVKIAELDIDKNRIKDAYLAVLDQEFGTDQLDGVLGANVLTLFDLDFDFSGHILNLFDRNDCGGGVVYWSARAGRVPFEFFYRHRIVVPVTLDGEQFRAIVATGSTFTLIDEPDAKRRFGLVPGGPGVEKMANVPKTFEIQYEHQFKTLTLGDVAVNAPVVGLEPDDIPADLRTVFSLRHDKVPEMIIGMDVLSKLHFYISYGQRMIYVTPADAGHPAAGTATASSAHWNNGG